MHASSEGGGRGQRRKTFHLTWLASKAARAPNSPRRPQAKKKKRREKRLCVPERKSPSVSSFLPLPRKFSSLLLFPSIPLAFRRQGKHFLCGPPTLDQLPPFISVAAAATECLDSSFLLLANRHYSLFHCPFALLPLLPTEENPLTPLLQKREKTTTLQYLVTLSLLSSFHALFFSPPAEAFFLESASWPRLASPIEKKALTARSHRPESSGSAFLLFPSNSYPPELILFSNSKYRCLYR